MRRGLAQWLGLYLLCGGAFVLVGCAAKKPLAIKPLQTIEFRGIKDGKCRVQDVQLDAKTGNEVVVCQ